MKKQLLLIATVLFAAACSSPKYAYQFDRYNYNSGKKTSVAAQTEQSPLTLQPEALVASADNSVVVLAEEAPAAAPAVSEADVKAFKEKYNSMSKAEKKALRQELKKEMKSYVKEQKKAGDNGASVNATKAMDHDLKLAAIFGAVGFVLLVLGGAASVFWVLGVISMVIGIVFFIKWLARQ